MLDSTSKTNKFDSGRYFSRIQPTSESTVSEELQRYRKIKNGKSIYEGEKLEKFERYVLGGTTLTGILSRFEQGLRGYLMENCKLDAIISLPRRSFYNTQNPTYILAFTKKNNEQAEQKLPIFTYIVREIGETRDVLRVPCRNDLKDMARQFKIFCADKELYEPRSLACKLLTKQELDAAKRWDVDRVFWTDDEKLQLGTLENQAITLGDFEAGTKSTMELIQNELSTIKAGAQDDKAAKFLEISLADEKYLKLVSGDRVTRKNCADHPGSIPIISGRGEKDRCLMIEPLSIWR